MKALAREDPRMIGGYRLRGQLGTGGMGRVYLGLSPGGRAVAIKVVHPDLARDAEFLRRFGQEVAAARAVSGIYTAPVVASGLEEHPPWLATAFVPGPSLDQVVSEHGQLPEAALWTLLAGLIEALQAIHGCGVVHRDLKPANVLLAIDGPRVIDFGISRAADGTALTAAGQVFGTPGYMSPEQAEGKAAGSASDVFALGCVIGYAATGSGPFGSGTAAAVLYRVVHGEPVLTGLPPQLRQAVLACLAKDPQARPTLPALASMITNGMHATGPSAVAFWPRSVADMISAYQARLEQEARAVDTAPAGAQGFSWASSVHSPTTPSDPGNRPEWSPPGQAGPAGGPGTGTRWPYAGPGQQSGLGQQVGPGQQWPQGGSGQQVGPGQQWPQGGTGQQGGLGQQGGSGQQGSRMPQVVPPPPRGYLGADGRAAASGGPVGYPQQYQLGSRGPIWPMPGSMVRAVRLMYAGAAYALIYAIGFVVVVSNFVKLHPDSTIARVGVAGTSAPLVFASLVEIVLWLWIARACRNRRKWARTTGTVLFGLHTLIVLGVAGNAHAVGGPAKLLTLIGWLIACGAVVFLWQRPSSAYFSAPDPMKQASSPR